MINIKRICHWLGMLLLGISLTGCLELNSHLIIHPAGDADLSVTLDASRMDEISKGFNSHSEDSMTCAKFLSGKEDFAKWKCEQVAASKIISQRHYSKEEATSFMEISNGLFGRHYKIVPFGALGPLSTDGTKVDLAGTGKQVAMLKSLGAVMTMEFEVPGKIVAIGNIKPVKSSNIQTIDLLDPLVWTDDFRVEAEDSKLELVVGMLVLALLFAAAGYAAKQSKTLSEGVRKAALPVSLSIAAFLMSFPWWWTPASATSEQNSGKSMPTSMAPASAPVATPAIEAPAPEAPAPEAPAEAPPLKSASDKTGDRFVNRRPHDVMEDISLAPRFQQLLGGDLDAVKEAVSVAPPTTRDAGYIIGSGNAPHSGGSNMAIWAIDTQDAQIYAVWKLDSQIKVYGVSNEKRLPAPLYSWYREMGGPN